MEEFSEQKKVDGCAEAHVTISKKLKDQKE